MKSETIPELRSRLKSATPEEAERIAMEIIEIRKREKVKNKPDFIECLGVIALILCLPLIIVLCFIYDIIVMIRRR